MKLNDKGFSLLEILAVIMLTAAVVFPLLTALTGNMEVNTRMHRRSAASLITVSAVQGFNTMSYRDVADSVLDAEDGYLRFDRDLCSQRDPETDLTATTWDICELVFELSMASETFYEADHFRAYVYFGDIDTAAIDDGTIPEPVLQEMTENDDEAMLYVTIWLLYDDRQERYLIRSGFLSRDFQLD